MMKKTVCRFLLFCLLAGMVLPVAAQQPFFRNISVNQGLTSSEVYKVFQDSKGFVWFCSDGGVCRFNGRSFKCFSTNDGLPDNTVFNIAEDSKGRIWLTCFNGRLCYIENETVREIGANNELQRLLSKGNFFITSAKFDTKDNLWLSTTQSMFRLYPKDNYATVETVSPCTDSAAYIISILDNNRTVISTHNSGRYRTQVEDLRYSICSEEWNGSYVFPLDTRHINSNPLYESVMLDNGKLAFSRGRWLTYIQPDGTTEQRAFEHTIIYLYQDKNGNLWVGLSKGGVCMFKNSDLKQEPVYFLKTLSISCIMIDHEDGIWFSTLEKGVFYSPFLSIFGYNNQALHEKITGVDNVFGKIYVANYKSEIYTINKNHQVERIPYYYEQVNASADKFHFYPHKNKVLIAGSMAGEYEPAAKKFVPYYFLNSRAFFSSRGVLIQENGKPLIICFSELLTINNNLAEIVGYLPSRGVTILRASDGTIYIGTLAGLYIYANGKFIKADFPGLNSERITCLMEYRDKLFIGTRSKGLFVKEGKRMTHISRSDGLPSNLCTDITVDSTGTFWLAGNRGITYFRLNEQNNPVFMKGIDISNGMPTNEISSLTKSGPFVFAGTRDGLCVINTNQKFYNDIAPPIIVSQIMVNGNKFNGRIGELEYNQNNLRFNIECLTYKSNFNPQYQYRLKGLSDKFKIYDRDQVEFLGLAAGSYEFEVYGINNNGVRSVKPVVIKFIIRPPFWLTWWFISVIACLLAITVYVLLRWRMKKFRDKENAKNEVNKMIADYQMTALRAQMNPHFIFNAINSIQNFILKEKTQQAYDYLAKFSKLVRKVLQNSGENMVSLEQEIEMLNLYAELEQLRFNHAFDFMLEIDPRIDIGEAMVPGMLLQPFIENAIWHGIMPLEGKRKGAIRVQIKPDADQLLIVIEDNGIGRERSRQISKTVSHRSVGIMLSDQRMRITEHLYGGKGSSIRFEDLYNKKGEPAGTKVMLSILYVNAL